MSKETEAISAVVRGIKVSLNTFAPARVVNFYEATQEADVEILFLTKNKQDELNRHPMIVRAPVQSMRYKVDGVVKSYTPVLQKGDVVFVAFAQRSLDNFRATPFDPDDLRTHDIRDAIVLGGWRL